MCVRIYKSVDSLVVMQFIILLLVTLTPLNKLKFLNYTIKAVKSSSQKSLRNTNIISLQKKIGMNKNVIRMLRNYKQKFKINVLVKNNKQMYFIKWVPNV